MSAREKADIGGSIKQQKMNCQGKQNCNNCERKQKCRNCRGKQKCKVKQTCNVNQSKCNLKQKKVHMKLKLCKVCGKEFEHRSSLSRHLRTHGVLPAVVCEICNTSFTRKDSLQKHRRKSKCGKLPSTEICASSTDEEVFVVSESAIFSVAVEGGKQCSIDIPTFEDFDEEDAETVAESPEKAASFVPKLKLVNICGTKKLI